MKFEILVLLIVSTSYVIGTPLVLPIDVAPANEIAKANCPEIVITCLILCPFGFAVDEFGCIMPCKCKDGPVAFCPLIGCLNYCPYGYIKDDKGCDTCKCQDAPKSNELEKLGRHVRQSICRPQTIMCLANVNCPWGFAVDSDGCPIYCVCASNPIIAICPLIACLNYCPNGYIKDDKGCDTCKCQDFSRPNQITEEVIPPKIIETGLRKSRQVFCRPQTIMCLATINCQFGFALDADGCPIYCVCATGPRP